MNTNNFFVKSALIAAMSLAFANSALADTAGTTFKVTTDVLKSCEVVAAPLTFTTYNPLSATPLAATSEITATCTAATSYNIGLDTGLNTSSSTTRAMIGDDLATTLLDYELYTEGTHSNIWGAPGGLAVVNQSGLGGGPLVYTVYGRIPVAQYVPAANYQDTIAVTVTY